MQLCNCPVSTTLTTIPAEGCAQSFGQIQKIAFCRLKKADGTLNKIAKASVGTLATWTALLAATDGTKVVVSPFIYAPTDGGGDAITYGSGNEVLGGIPEVVGSNPVTFSAQLRHVASDVVAAMKELICEARSGNLGVYLFSETGQIEAKTDGTDIFPIPIRSFFVSDKKHGNLDQYDYHDLSWGYMPNYSDNLTIITPSFDPLTELTPEA